MSTSRAIVDLSAEFIADGGNGLLLPDPPPGSGKSFAAHDLIAMLASGRVIDGYDVNRMQRAIREAKGRKIFYLTMQIKNLLQKAGFVNMPGMNEAFVEKEFLTLKSKYDSLTDGMNAVQDSKGFQKFLKETRKSETWDELKGYLKEYNNEPDKKRQDFLCKEIDQVESQFRDSVKSYIRKEGFTPEEFADIARENEKWKWVGELYPSVFLWSADVVLLTVKKFYYPIDTIVGGVVCLMDPDCVFTENAIIIIDEFDRAKPEILDAMIESSIRGRNDDDMVYFCRRIRDAATRMERNSPFGAWETEEEKNRIKKLKAAGDELMSRYHLDYPCKLDPEERATEYGIIFRDSSSDVMIDRNGGWSSIRCKPGEYVNKIVVDSKENNEEADSDIGKIRDSGEAYPINDMIRDAERYIHLFYYTVTVLAEKYIINARAGASEKMDTGDAIKNILEEFGFTEQQYRDSLYDHILEWQWARRPWNRKFRTRGITSFYTNGFSYTSLKNDITHESHTKIYFCGFYKVPEAYLLSLCRKAMVIGLSATESLRTIENFDLEYLAKELDTDFHARIPDNRMKKTYLPLFKAIDEEYVKSLSGYKDYGPNGEIEPHADVIQGMNELAGRTGEKLMEKLLEDQKAGDKLYNKLDIHVGGDEFRFNRYYRCAEAYKRFLEDQEAQSMLIVVNRIPKDGKNDEFSKNMLWELFEKVYRNIIDPKGLPEGEDYFRVLDSFRDGCSSKEGYEKNLKDIMRWLSQGGKKVVISAYKTIGTGQNLQYDIPEECKGKLLKVNKDREDKKKDFDFCYLEKPTHVVDYLSGTEITEKDLVSFFYDVEYACVYNQITRATKRKCIQYGIDRYLNQGNPTKKRSGECPVNRIRDSEATADGYTSIIIQAVGRLTRTNNKIGHPIILADSDMAGHVGTMLPAMVSPEVKALYGTLEKEKKRQQEEGEKSQTRKFDDPFLAQADYMENCCEYQLSYLLKRGDWEDSSMEEYRFLRETTARYPTAGDEDLEKATPEERYFIRTHYVDRGNGERKPVFYHNSGTDYRGVRISLEKTDRCSLTFSEEETGLDLLMENRYIRKEFQVNGYATRFNMNARYVLPPVLEHNIYMGRIGELAVKIIFRQDPLLSVDLEEIEDKECFELVDYRIRNTSIAVDAKNWRKKPFKEGINEIREKIFDKAERISWCHCIVVVNILAAEGEEDLSPREFEIETVDGGRKIDVLFLPTLLNPMNLNSVDTPAIDRLHALLKKYRLEED